MDVKTKPILTLTLRLPLKTVLVVTLLSAVLLSSMWCGHQATATNPAMPLLASNQNQRAYYLSGPVLNATYALGACESGYHLASLWELLDTSNLAYNRQSGIFAADSGEGPPTVYEGWVRTGYGSNNSTTSGQANCNTWTATTGSGTTIALPSDWINGTKHMGVWSAGTSACGSPGYAWCVED